MFILPHILIMCNVIFVQVCTILIYIDVAYTVQYPLWPFLIVRLSIVKNVLEFD